MAKERKKRKMNIPKEKQIEGLRKALENPKTPQQLRPSLERRLAAFEAGAEARPAAAPATADSVPTNPPQRERGFNAALDHLFKGFGE